MSIAGGLFVAAPRSGAAEYATSAVMVARAGWTASGGRGARHQHQPPPARAIGGTQHRRMEKRRARRGHTRGSLEDPGGAFVGDRSRRRRAQPRDNRSQTLSTAASSASATCTGRPIDGRLRSTRARPAARAPSLDWCGSRPSPLPRLGEQTFHHGAAKQSRPEKRNPAHRPHLVSCMQYVASGFSRTSSAGRPCTRTFLYNRPGDSPPPGDHIRVGCRRRVRPDAGVALGRRSRGRRADCRGRSRTPGPGGRL